MLPFDTIVILSLYYIPLVFFFLWASKADYNNTVWLIVWAFITYYIVYKSYDYISEILILSLFLVGFTIINVLGVRLFISQSLSETTGLVSPVPIKFTLRAVRETCMEIQGEWYCLKKNGGSVKVGKVWVNCKVERLKRGLVIGLEGTPDSESFFTAISVALLYSVFFIYLNYFAPSFDINVMGYQFYSPIFSVVFALVIGFSMTKIRKDILRILSLTIIKLRGKLIKAKELYEALQIMALAERVKEKKRREKIKKAAELAKALEIAKKITGKKTVSNSVRNEKAIEETSVHSTKTK